MVDRVPLKVPLTHANEAEHRKMLAVRANACLTEDPSEFSVEAFGAVGNGSTDDLASINAAIAAANAAGGGTVVLGPHTYSISAAITKKSNVILRGAGKQSTVIKPSGNTDGIGSATGNYFGIEHLCVDMSNTTNKTAIIMRDQYWWVDHVYIKQMSSFGVEFSFADYARITNCIIDRDVALTTTNFSLISFSGNYATNILIAHNKLVKVGAMSPNGQSIWIIGNEMSGHGYGGAIFCEADTLNKDFVIAYNHIHDSNQADDADATVITGTETWSRNTIIHGNHIHGMWGAGIQVQAPDCRITDNLVYNNCTKGASSGAGQIELLSRGSAFAYAQPDRCIVAHNSVYDDNALAPYAYHEAAIGGSAQAENVKLIGNSWRGGVTATKLILSTTTWDDEIGWRHHAKVTDETTNTDTTLSNDTALTFPVLASTKYRFKFVVFYDTPTAADFKFDVNGPAAATLVQMKTKAIAPGATAESAVAIQTAFAFGPTAVTETAGTNGYCEVEGILQNGANAGTVAFRWAQNTSNGSNTTVRAGSYVQYAVVS